jgi:hypothetical protein
MSTYRNYLAAASSSLRNLGLLASQLPDGQANPSAYGRTTTGAPTALFADNMALLLWQGAGNVVRMSALLLAAGLSTLALATSAHGQAMVKLDAPAMDDNSRIVEMTNKGLDDSIIVAKIKSGDWSFKLDDDAVIALRNRGVSAPVVAAMVDASVLTTAKVTVDFQPVKLDTMGQAKTAGRLLNNLSGDLTPLTVNAFLEGPSAKAQASPMPEILVTLPKGESIESYILVQLNAKNDRRELPVGSGGGLTGTRTGVGPHSIRPIHVIERGDNTFQVQPLKPLKPGEYMVYVIGSADERKDIYAKGYPFSVGR